MSHTWRFLAMMFSGAEVTAPRLWMLWGMLAVGLRHAWLVESADRESVYTDSESIFVPLYENWESRSVGVSNRL